MPALLELTYADGTAAADGATKKWLAEARGTAGPAISASGATGDNGSAARISEAKALIQSGKAAEGLNILQESVRTSGSGEARFETRLALAEACVAAGQVEVARGLYATLDEEGRSIQLDVWNPALAAKCLRGLLLAIRQSKKARPGLEAEVDALYKRLCQVDPAAALRLGQ
jgi:hypothetical protein